MRESQVDIYKFVVSNSIPISYKELVEEMKAEKPFNAKLKKGKPVYVIEFKYD